MQSYSHVWESCLLNDDDHCSQLVSYLYNYNSMYNYNSSHIYRSVKWNIEPTLNVQLLLRQNITDMLFSTRNCIFLRSQVVCAHMLIESVKGFKANISLCSYEWISTSSETGYLFRSIYVWYLLEAIQPRIRTQNPW